jgi:hypothetical protein
MDFILQIFGSLKIDWRLASPTTTQRNFLFLSGEFN